eukprot:c19900_g1_i1.p1 GENE.c19900_g1_i1~~c19900_g1_i1.p1  ORF type:complete len:866 (-),score=363.11 c19900_g1_i1:110-2707(-)
MTSEEAFPVKVIFEVWSPPPPADFRLIITGSIPELGSWFTDKPVSMEQRDQGIWRLAITLKSTDSFEYKYACYSNREGRCVGFEQGPNRPISVLSKLENQTDVDPETGERLIRVRDVWSAANDRSKVNAGAVTTHAGSNKDIATSAANYLKNQILQDRRSQAQPIAQATQPVVDPQLEQKMTKLQQDATKLRKDLEESQKKCEELEHSKAEIEQKRREDHERLNQTLNEKEEKIKSLSTQLNALSSDAQQGQRELSQRIQENDKTIANLNSQIQELQQDLNTQKSKLQETLTEKDNMKKQLKDSQQSSNVYINQLEIAKSVVSDFSKSVRDPNVRRQVEDENTVLQERLQALLLYFEAESKRIKINSIKAAHRSCSILKKEYQKVVDGLEDQVSQRVKEVADSIRHDLTEYLRDVFAENKSYKERYEKQFNERKKLANELVDIKGKIRVYGRARPFNERELNAGHYNVLAFPEKNRLLIGADAEKHLLANDLSEGTSAVGENKLEDVKTYELDHIFPPNSTQEEVFEEVRHLIGSVADGYNVTIFAYGQTGSGKTHTMDGSPGQRGISHRALELFFNKSNSDSSEHSKKALKTQVLIYVSMLEIYNEEIRDLLAENDPKQKNKVKLEVRQSPDGGSYVSGLTKLSASTLEDALRIMDIGRGSRKTSETKMNERSSRSHMVFTAYLEMTNPITKEKVSSKLHLVDLAGSERVSKTKATGEQLKEASFINQSLSALGDVIGALTTKSKKQTHVPYRNSKLTHLLQDSLCGTSRTAMFVTLSPSSDNFWETISTLNFGARAASVELGQATKQVELGEVTKLKEQLKKMQGGKDLTEDLLSLQTELESREKQVESLMRQLEEAGIQPNM